MSPALAQLQTNGQINASNEQAFRANAHFYRKVTLHMGGGPLGGIAQQHLAIGQIYALLTPLSSLTTATVVAGQTLPAYTFSTKATPVQGDARVLRGRVYGKCAANGNTKVINLVFGTATIALLNAASNAKDFCIDFEIYPTGLNTQQLNIGGYANAALLNGLSASETQTTTGALDVKISVPATTGAADVVINGLDIFGES
jgi:hypothetical protein